MSSKPKVSELNPTFKKKLYTATLHLDAAIKILTSGVLSEIFKKETEQLQEAGKSISRKIMEDE